MHIFKKTSKGREVRLYNLSDSHYMHKSGAAYELDLTSVDASV